MIDPMVNKEWVPVRARDPRLMPMLQAYAAANLTTIPPSYMALAAAPVKTHFLNDNPVGRNAGNGQQGVIGGNSRIGAGSGNAQIGVPSETGPVVQPVPGAGNGNNGQPGGQNSTGAPRAGTAATQNTASDDDDDDDDDDTGDPLAHFLKNEPKNMPIVGVAPNLKGPCVHPLYGMTRYEQWVFIYLPPANLPTFPQQPGQIGQPNGRPPLRVSQ